MLFENVVAQMLVAAGHKLYFYNHYNSEMHRNDMEIDFIIISGDKTNGGKNMGIRTEHFSNRSKVFKKIYYKFIRKIQFGFQKKNH